MNSSQLIIELILIATTFIVTVFLLTRSYRHTDAVSTKIQKTITGLLGAFLIMAGTVKFFEPFTTMFTSQIFLSELPYHLSKVPNQKRLPRLYWMNHRMLKINAVSDGVLWLWYRIP